MIRLIKGSLIVGIIAICSIAFSANDWTLKKVKDGVSVYNKDIPGSDYKEMKAESVSNIPFEVVVEVAKDFDRYFEWYGMTKTIKPINVRSATDFDVYFVLAVPVLKNRDAIMRVKIETDYAKGICKTTLKSIDSDYGKENKLVRMPSVEGVYIITRISPTQTKGVYQVHADLGGSIPASIVNLMATKHPLDTAIGAINQCYKPIYADRASKLHNRSFVVSR